MWAPSRKERYRPAPSTMWKRETCKVGPPGRLNSLGHGDSERRSRTCKGMVRMPSDYVWILSSPNRVRGQRQAWLFCLCLSTCYPKWTWERTSIWGHHQLCFSSLNSLTWLCDDFKDIQVFTMLPAIHPFIHSFKHHCLSTLCWLLESQWDMTILSRSPPIFQLLPKTPNSLVNLT